MIGFERVGHLVALASDNLKPEIYDSLCVTSESLEVSFDAYVKSQVHLNLTDDLFSRPLRRYVHAMRFLDSKESCYREDVFCVLRWFYSDMANFLIHNAENVRLHVIVGDALNLPEASYSLTEVQDEFDKVKSEHSVEAVRKFKYSELLRKIKSRRDLQAKPDNCMVAAVLLKEAENKELQKVVFVEELK